MSVAQFDALLAELEPCIKKTTDFCELCVQGSIYSALFCKMKWVNLTIAILDFGACLYGGSERSKHLSKCLLRMWKNLTRYNFFLWRTNISEAVCTGLTKWGRIYFSTCKNFWQIFRTCIRVQAKIRRYIPYIENRPTKTEIYISAHMAQP